MKASDRDSAFAALKAQGIRPSKVEEAQGFFNKLFGKGKRWMAIAVLAPLAAIGWWLAVSERESDWEERAQIFGEPATLQRFEESGWREAFSDVGDAWLARHAIPGRICDCAMHQFEANSVIAALESNGKRFLAIRKSDGEEIRKMKRMVNCMKRELSNYQKDGGSIEGYVARCCERLRLELQIYDDFARELSQLASKLEGDNRISVIEEWDRKNSVLQSMGLPTIPIPGKRNRQLQAMGLPMLEPEEIEQ